MLQKNGLCTNQDAPIIIDIVQNEKRKREICCIRIAVALFCNKKTPEADASFRCLFMMPYGEFCHLPHRLRSVQVYSSLYF